jgi:DmsE family decaheme c-type cytochrome
MMANPRFTPAAASGRKARHRAAYFLACLAPIAFFIQLQGHSQEPQPAPAAAQTESQAPATNAPAEYVGSETCAGCHEDMYKLFQRSVHQQVDTSKKYHFETRACEACHGPGSKHVESTSPADIVMPSKMKTAAADRICLTCHKNETTHIGRINSGHAKNEVSCTACHSVHTNNGQGGFTAVTAVAGVKAGAAASSPMSKVNQLCASCHADVWASFQQPFRHKLPEGAMSCVDCHNPHGSFLPGAARTSRQAFAANEPGCFRCHGDLMGPFTFEHAPVKLEGCTTCHAPHGTNNPRMLTRSEVRFVCLECHANLPLPTVAAGTPLGGVPPAFHDLRSPRFRECSVCHQKIHGSYVDGSLER